MPNTVAFQPPIDLSSPKRSLGDIQLNMKFNYLTNTVPALKAKKRKWAKIAISDEQLKSLNTLINKSFKGNGKTIISNAGYGGNDEFFEATGSYSCLYTCNTWVNSTLKKSGIKACLWTPFDSALINLHKKK